MVECGQFLRTGESVVSEVHPYEFVLREMHCTTHYNDRHEHTHIYAWHARRKPVGAEPIFGPGIALHAICVKHLVRHSVNIHGEVWLGGWPVA